MKESLVIMIPMIYSSTISLIIYLFDDNKYYIFKLFINITYIFSLMIFYINNPEIFDKTWILANISVLFIINIISSCHNTSKSKKPTHDNQIHKFLSFPILTFVIFFSYLFITKYKEPMQNVQIDESILDELKYDFKTNNYEHMLETAEIKHVMDSEIMLNVLGIMYAQGIYYEQSYEKAIESFNAATEYGNLESSFTNLWLASYFADLNNLNNDTSYSNSMHAIKVSEKHQNYSINEMLKAGISIRFNETVENGYEYIKKLTYKKRQYFFELFDPQVDSVKYIYKITSTEMEERELPVYLFRFFWPDNNYIAFDSISLSPASSTNYKVTGHFKYEASYKDINGNTYFWVDTDEYYYGEVPPDTDENSRWIIDGYDRSQNVRIYKLQVLSTY